MPRKKADPEELRQLTEVFQKTGAPQPEDWARSQLEEGIPQLAVYCFTKSLWEGVVDENDPDWIDEQIEASAKWPHGECAMAGPALTEMLSRGVSREAITDLVRVMQYQTLFHVCVLIDGASVPDLPVKDWTLYQTDDEGKPLDIIQGTHEVLVSLDPTGRELGPRRPSD